MWTRRLSMMGVSGAPDEEENNSIMSSSVGGEGGNNENNKKSLTVETPINDHENAPTASSESSSSSPPAEASGILSSPTGGGRISNNRSKNNEVYVRGKMKTEESLERIEESTSSSKIIQKMRDTFLSSSSTTLVPITVARGMRPSSISHPSQRKRPHQVKFLDTVDVHSDDEEPSQWFATTSPNIGGSIKNNNKNANFYNSGTINATNVLEDDVDSMGDEESFLNQISSASPPESVGTIDKDGDNPKQPASTTTPLLRNLFCKLPIQTWQQQRQQHQDANKNHTTNKAENVDDDEEEEREYQRQVEEVIKNVDAKYLNNLNKGLLSILHSSSSSSYSAFSTTSSSANETTSTNESSNIIADVISDDWSSQNNHQRNYEDNQYSIIDDNTENKNKTNERNTSSSLGKEDERGEDAILVDLPEQKRQEDLDYLTRILMGGHLTNTNNHNEESDEVTFFLELPSDQIANQKMRNEIRLKYGAGGVADNNLNNVDDENQDDNYDDDTDNNTTGNSMIKKILTAMEDDDDCISTQKGGRFDPLIIPDFLLQYEYDYEKGEKEEAHKMAKVYPPNAWWLADLEALGCFDYDTNNFDVEKVLGLIGDAKAKKEKKGISASGLEAKSQRKKNRQQVNFVGENGKEKSSDEKDEIEQEEDGDGNDDDDDSTILGGSLENDDSDWEETLWTVARSHYRDVYQVLVQKDGNNSDELVRERTPDDDDDVTANASVKNMASIVDEKQKSVSKFRSLLKDCLHAYVTIFHVDWDLSDDEQFQKVKNNDGIDNQRKQSAASINKMQGETEENVLNLNLPNYVPLNVAKSLFKEVIRSNFLCENASSASDETINTQDRKVRTPEPPMDESHINKVVDIITMILLSDELGGFRHYDIEFNTFATGMNESLKDILDIEIFELATTKENDDYTKLLSNLEKKTSPSSNNEIGHHRVRRRRTDQNRRMTQQELEEERFLYGMTLENGDDNILNNEKDKKDDDKDSDETLEGNKKEEEIRLRTGFKDFLLLNLSKSTSSTSQRAIWLDRFAQEFLLRMIPVRFDDCQTYNLCPIITLSEIEDQTELKEETDLMKAMDTFCFGNPSAYAPSLDEAYILMYAPVLLMRCWICCHGKETIINNKTSALIQILHKVLLDTKFAKCRMFVFGPRNSSAVQTSDWLALRTVELLSSSSLSSPVTNFPQLHGHKSSPSPLLCTYYINEEDRKGCINLHNMILTTLREILSEVQSIHENSAKFSIPDSNSIINERFQRLNDLIIDCDGKRKRMQLLRPFIVSSCLDIGQVIFGLGLSLGEKEKHFKSNTPSSSDDKTEVSFRDNTRIELSTYALACDAYRCAIQILAEVEADIETNLEHDQENGDVDKLYIQKEQIHELKASSELYLADTLAAIGFCHDSKLSENDQALSSYTDALSTYTKHLGNKHEIVANTLQNLGALHAEMSNWKDAVDCYQKRLLILEQLYCTNIAHFFQDGQDGAYQESDDLSKMEEIAYSVQCVAKSKAELNLYKEAIHFYKDAISKFRIIANHMEKTQSGEIYNIQLSISAVLVEMSNVFYSQASDISCTWNTFCFKAMYSHHGALNRSERKDHLLHRIINIEKDTMDCLDESLHLREQYRTKLSDGNSNAHLPQEKGLDIVTPDKAIMNISQYDLINDLLRNANLKIRHHLYEIAENLLFQAWSNLMEDCKCDLDRYFSEDRSESTLYNFIDSGDAILTALPSLVTENNNTIAIQVLFSLGILSTRLLNYERAVSCFCLALEIFSDETDQDAWYFVDVGKLHENIGNCYILLDDVKSAASHLRSALRFYDQVIDACNGPDDPNHVGGIGSNPTNFLEVYTKITIGIILYLLGRTYEESDHAPTKALAYYEDSMLVLDGMLEVLQDWSIPKSADIFSETKIRHELSPAPLRWALGYAYHKAGKIYLSCELYHDALLSFERSIEIFEGCTKLATISLKHDSECIPSPIERKKEDEELHELYVLTLDVIDDNDFSTSFTRDEEATNDQNHFTPEDLLFRLGNSFASRKQYIPAIRSYRDAELLTEERLGTRDHIIIANILYNLGTVYSDIYFNEFSDAAEKNAVQCLEASIDISSKTTNNENLLTVDSMFRLISLRLKAHSEEGSGGVLDEEILNQLDECIAVKIRIFGEINVEIASMLECKGYFYYHTGHPDKATEVFRRVISIRKHLFGVLDLDTTDNLYSLGLAHKKHAESYRKGDSNSHEKHLRLAEESFVEAVLYIKRIENSIASDHKMTTKAGRCKINASKNFFQLGLVHESLGDFYTSLQFFAQVIKIVCPLLQRKVWKEILSKSIIDGKLGLITADGDFQIMLSTTWMKIGLLLERCKKFSDSLESLQKSLVAFSFPSSRRRNRESSDEKVVQTYGQAQLHLARVWFKSARFEKAFNLYTDCMSAIRRRCKALNLDAALILTFTGRCCAVMREDNRAYSCYLDALQIISREKYTSSSMISESKALQGILHQSIALTKQKVGEFKSALEHIFHAVSLIEEIQNENADFHIGGESLTDVIFSTEDWTLRLFECYIVMLQLLMQMIEEPEQKEEAAEILLNIGNVYTRFGRYDEAFQCFLSVVTFRYQSGKENRLPVADLLFNLGNIYIQNEDKWSAVLCHKVSHNTSLSVLGEESIELAESIMLLGSLSFQLCLYDDAKKWCAMGLQLKEIQKKENLSTFIRILHLKGIVHDRCGENEASIACLQEALTIGERIWDSKSLMKTRQLEQSFSHSTMVNDGMNINTNKSNILNSLGNSFWKEGNTEKAIKCYAACLEIRQHSGDSLGIANVKNNIGAILMSHELQKPASAFYAEALRVKSIELGDNDVEVARTVCNLGQYLMESNVVNASLAYFQEGIRILRSNLNDDHFEVAVCLYHLGVIKEEIESYEEALTFYLQFLGIFQKLNIRNSMMACALHSVGFIYSQSGDFPRGLEYLQSSILLKKEYFAENHELLVESQNLMAEIQAKIDGMHPPNTTDDNLAIEMAIKNHEEEVLYLNERDSTTQEDKIELYCKLGTLYVELFDFKKAAFWYEKSLTIQKQLTNELPASATLHNLGNCYANISCSKAILCYEESLEISKRILGEEDEAVIDTMYSLGRVFCERSNFDSSVVHFHKTLDLQVKLFGPSSPHVVGTLKEMGKVFFIVGKYDSAMKACQDALQLVRHSQDDNASIVFDIQFCIGQIYISKEEYEKALVHLKRAQSSDINTPRCLFEIGCVHEKRMESELAGAHFFEALLEVEKQLQLDIHYGWKNNGNTPAPTLSEQELLEKRVKEEDCPTLDFCDSIHLYSALLYKIGNNQLALSGYDMTIPLYIDILGHDALRVGEILHKKGACLARLREYDEAVIVLSQALDIKTNKFGTESHQSIQETTLLLAECHFRVGHVEKAMVLYKREEPRLLEKVKFDDGAKNDVDKNILLNIGKLHHKQENFSEALEYYALYLQMTKRSKRNMYAQLGEGIQAIGEVFYDVGNYSRALFSFEQALGIFEESGNGNVCEVLLSMAALFFDNDRFLDCRDCCKRCLKIQKNSYNQGDVRFVQTFMQFGAACLKMKAFTEAKENYNQAMALLDTNCGSCINFALCWYELGLVSMSMEEKETREALSCFQHALDMMNDLLDKNDVKIGNTLHNIGICLSDLKEYESAVTSLSEALRLRKMHYGNNNDTADSCYYLAMAQLSINDVQSALENFEQVVAIKIPMLETGCLKEKEEADAVYQSVDAICSIVRTKDGTSTIRYAESLQKKATCMALKRQLNDAIELHAESIKVVNTCEEPKLTKAIFIGNAAFNIGICFNRKGDSDKAIRYLKKSLQILTEKLGDDDMVTADALYQLGISFKVKENNNDAKKCLEDALHLVKQKSLYNSTKAAEILELIGDVAVQENDVKSAENYYLESCRIKNNHLDKAEMAAFHSKLGAFFKSTGDFSSAILHYEKCLLLRKVNYGDKAENVLLTYLDLGSVHDLQQNVMKSMVCFDVVCTHSINRITMRNAYTKKGRLLMKHDQLEEALSCFQRAIQLFENSKDHLEEKASILSDQGEIFKEIGNENSAMSCFNSALSIFETSSGRKHVGTANTLQRMTNFMIQRRDFHSAYQYAEDALDIRQALHGMDHEDTGESLFSKGLILFHREEHEAALSCIQLASYILEKLKGELHPMLIDAKFLKGSIQCSFSLYDDALSTLKDSLIKNKKIYGANHINVGKVFYQLGKVHRGRKELHKSFFCFKECIRIYTTSTDSDHIELATALVDIAETLKMQDSPDEALHCFTEAIHMFEIIDGADPSIALRIAKCHFAIGEIHDEKGDLHKGIECYIISSMMYSRVEDNVKHTALKKEDLHTHASLTHKLASALDRKGDLSAAVMRYSRAIQLYKQLFDDGDNVFVAHIFEDIGNLRVRQKKFDKACVLLEEALRIRVNIAGPDDLSVANTLYTLGIIFDHRREFDAASKAFTDCLLIQEKKLGPDKEECADTLVAYGSCLGNCGEYAHAIINWREAHRIYTKCLGYDVDHPKVKALDKKRDIASKCLHNRIE